KMTTTTKPYVTVIWISGLVISLFVESCHAQKLNIQWGPQSMMYLKGKREYLSDNEAGDLKQGPEGRYATLKGKLKLCFFFYSISRPI
uniref:Uncharacterized protein n=1 Tax=Gadus morhua TaxID=8049 RepID=A0A8C5BKY5_GADMO